MNAPTEILLASVKKNSRSAYTVALRDIGDGPSVAIAVVEQNGKQQLVVRTSGLVIKAEALGEVVEALQRAHVILGGRP